MGEIGTILGGVSAKQSGELAKQQADINAQLSEIAAAETGAEHRRQLDTALGAIDVALGASNIAASSPTVLAAIAGTRKDFRRARIIDTANLLNQASQFRREGRIRLFEGKAARNIAFASAAGSFSEDLINAGAFGGGGADINKSLARIKKAAG